MKLKLLCLALSLASACVHAQSLEERLAMAAQNVKIDEVVSLPVQKLKAVESEGQIVFMSENGRFVFIGQIYDVWQRKSLDTMGQIKNAVNKLSFENMGLEIDELNTLSMGVGKHEVVVFVDPFCSICHTLMKDAKSLTDKYTFKFVVVPALGQNSIAPTKTISCAKDRDQALVAFMSDNIESLPTIQSCDSKRFNTTLVAADLMGINGVPFVVAPNGDIKRGRPANLENWLQERTL